jgi:hypothetical protein
MKKERTSGSLKHSRLPAKHKSAEFESTINIREVAATRIISVLEVKKAAQASR